MATRLPARWAGALCHRPVASTAGRPRTVPVLLTEQRAILPRTAKRGVKYGWLTAPKRGPKPHHYNGPKYGLPAPTAGLEAALNRRTWTTPQRTGVLAIKKGVSAMFMGKRRLPCTILQMDQVEVVASRTKEVNGYWGVQIGLGSKTPGNETAPMLGYYEAKGLAPKRHLAEFRVRTEDGLLPVGLQMQPDWFKLGQYVDARSNSRGMGFAGGMKRHGFAGQGASHGNSKNHRTIGTNGPSQGGGSRVHPGKKMPGRMGNEQVTVQNLKVLKIDNEMGIVVINGHVAGPKGCVVKLSDAIKKGGPSDIFIDKSKRILMERNAGHEERYETARKRHMELKEMRKEGTIGAAITLAPEMGAPLANATA